MWQILVIYIYPLCRLLNMVNWCGDWFCCICLENLGGDECGSSSDSVSNNNWAILNKINKLIQPQHVQPWTVTRVWTSYQVVTHQLYGYKIHVWSNFISYKDTCNYKSSKRFDYDSITNNSCSVRTCTPVCRYKQNWSLI